jgi:ATP-dependent exoDNAse (exonuclease V) alpha subunit
MLKLTDLIIWDEAPMQHRYVAEAVNRTMVDIIDPDGEAKLFGGVTMVFCGDWRQCLPVIPRGLKEDIVKACLTRSQAIWSKIKVLQLTENMRLEATREDRDFAKWLLEVGEGLHTEPDGTITLPASVRCRNNTIQQLIQHVFPNLNQQQPDDYFGERAILTSRNADVRELNDLLLDMFPGEERIYLSADSIKSDSADEGDLNTEIPPEVLASIDSASLPLAKLKLKVGAPVMLLRNLDPAHGLCNGTRAVITQMRDRVLQVRITTGDFKGQLALIPRISIESNPDDFTFTLSRRQFPIRLCYAMTINKSQGQSVKILGLDLRSPVFTHGQLYVALSRCTSLSRLKVLFPPGSTDTKTTNVVYKEALLQSNLNQA